MNELIIKAGREIEYEERAAILEFDGGLDRAEAERRAELEIIKLYIPTYCPNCKKELLRCQ